MIDVVWFLIESGDRGQGLINGSEKEWKVLGSTARESLFERPSISTKET